MHTCSFGIQKNIKLTNVTNKLSPTISIYVILRVLKYPYIPQICIHIKIQHHYFGYTEYQNFLLGNLKILIYNIHCSFIWWLDIMGKTWIWMTRIGNIMYWILWHILKPSLKKKHNILPISIRLRTVLKCNKMWIRNGGYWQNIKMLQPWSFQESANKDSLRKNEYTIIQCLDVNTQ